MNKSALAERTVPARHAALPPTLAPRGLAREEAAAYIGVSSRMFDEMVRDGRMPKAKRINARSVWDRRAIDAAFDELPSPGENLPADVWDNVD